ncbi:amino acid adenylation domain-containing protein [Massilia forsythiae]|uniref:Amino acid adenylation domain-containing protein n=1 Tax=Massilia forsythiae TaxID=2728020 RepID=A0A7Z2ZTF1_9BURK|nr:non-ribosomal peptide synthetase [Massilia forsythiae]QJE01528.1 amino acid adenylation domain-containing protein [Massilia forsythiae]
MNVVELMGEAARRGVHFYLDGEQLAYKAAAGAMDAAFRQRTIALKPELVRLLKESRAVAGAIQVQPRPAQACFPLSYGQQRLWFIEQMEAGGQYNIPSALSLTGRLDQDALQRALDEIVRRHEVLRSVYRSVDGEGVQEIAAAKPVALVLHDLADLEGGAQDERVRALAAAAAAEPFDLAAGAVLRAWLLRLGAGRHVLLVTLHHIAADGWSMGVIVREFCALYQAFSAGRASPLAPLPLQYADFAHWQRAQETGARLARQLDYWRARLDGLPQVHSLPLDKPRPARQRHEGRLHLQTIGAPLAARLKALGSAHQATLFMVLHSAFALLLGRWSNETDIVIGSPIAGRSHKELEGLVGLFVNTLVLRTGLDLDAGFVDLLGEGKATLLDAYAHQDMPFEKLVDALRPERSLAHAPLFQVMFSMQNNEAAALELPGLQVAGLGGGPVVTKFDLELSAAETVSGLVLSWNYADSLFDDATIARMADSFSVLLQAITDAPAAPVGTLPMLAAADRARLAAWSGHGVPYQDKACVHTLFEAQAARTPDAVALACGADSLSYRALNEQANRIAHRLRELGVGPDVLVGLYAERSTPLLAGLLGILKAGGAFVPLDPSCPRARLAFMLEDCAPRVILTQAHLRGVLPDSTAEVLCLEDASIHGQPCADLAPEAIGLAPSHLAYVIYTSGSTGRPKGVMVEHGSIAGHAVAAQHFHGLRASDRILMFSTPSVDAALELPLCAWQAGAGVRLRGRELLLPQQFLAFCRSHGITAADLPPAYLNELAADDAADAGAWRETSLRLLVAGGEAFPGALLVRWRELGLFEHCRLVNAYGPTEATISASLGEVTEGCDPAAVPLGAALPGRVFSVRDATGALVPPGVAGELHIEGPALARGYLGQDALSAERFAVHEGGRRYRTGDMVRWNARGELLFAGRADDQVKVRGFRVELGEIGACLIRHPALRDAVVQVRGSGAARYLAAYVVPAAGAAADSGALTATLRAFLKDQLADYMLPSAYVVLDCLPLLPNGKVDKRALPEPGCAARDDAPAPSTPTEIALAEIWAGLLGLGRVAADANFFEIGGHSLLAMRMLSAVGRQLGVTLQVRAVFEHKTLAAIAALIDSGAGAVEGDQAPIPLADRAGALAPSFAQRRLWFIDQLEGGSSQYHIPVALRLDGRLDRAALQSALDALVARHEVLRTTYAIDDACQLVAPPRPLELATDDLSGLGNDERLAAVRRLGADDAARPFDLQRDLMLRARLVRLAPEQHVLLVTLHHIAADGWSMDIIVREFGALYAAFGAGRPMPLTALPLQYADYAQWHRDRLDGGTMARQLDYWQARLQGLPQVHSLPLDRTRPPEQRFEGRLHAQSIGSALHGRLAALAQAHDATLFMVLQSAFALLLARWSNETDVVIGSPVAGRPHHDLEGVVGLFVNTLVLRSQVDLDAGFDVLLARSREALLEAYAHQDLPFEKLVDALKPERSLAHAPLFQVMFSMQNNKAAELHLPGLQVTGMAGSHVVAKFDLELSAAENADGIALVWNHAASLFDQSTIARMADSFAALLEAIVAAPSRAVGELEIVGAADARQLAAWNATAQPYPDRACIHQLFEAKAECSPDATALVCGDTRLSYRELNAAANRIAHRLRAEGVGPDTMVGLCVERSIEMVAGVFGILKAGGAYVPLDPAYPRARLDYMLRDCAPRVVLTQSHLLGVVPVAAGPVLCLDDPAQFAGQPDSDIDAAAIGLTPSNLAYVIYTSGSTGQPKGVMSEHGGLVNRIVWMQDAYRIEASDRVLQKTPFSFDVSVWELTWPFIAGASLVMAKPEGHKDPAYLADLIEREEVTVLHFVPSMLGAMLDSGRWGGCATVRQVFCSGEALPFALQRQFQACHGAALHNLYGPTEASIDVSHYTARANYPNRVVPIGRPIRNTVLSVLNPKLCDTPIGVAGELHIGGVGLARGYLNRPDLTAERFIAGPGGARLYKTGDIVRFLPDGNLEYLGRADHQVKLRGLRIELGEIESRLRALDGVHDAVVVAWGKGADMRLAAYVQAGIAPADEATFCAALQAGLRASLPEFMVPADFMVLERFPLSANGKLDRKQLPAIERGSRIAASHVAPAGALEILLCKLWAAALGLAQVGAEDNYFAIGGDSIKAIALVSSMKSAGVQVSVRDLFAAKTVRALALLAAADGTAAQPQEELAPFAMLTSAENAELAVLRAAHLLEDAYPLTRLQQGMVLHHQLDEHAGTYHDVLNVRVRAPLALPAFHAALDGMVAAHPMLRTVYALNGERPLQLVYRHGDAHLEVLDAGTGGEAHAMAFITELVERERRSSIRFEQALWKIILVRIDDSQFQFIFSFHHSMLDGWSVASLNTELFNRYAALAADGAAPQPGQALPYRYYVQQEQQALADDGARGYWARLLEGAPPAWWSGRPRGATATLAVPIGAATSARLAEVARSLGVQEKSVLQAAHLVLLSMLTGQADVLTSVVANGRPERAGADLTLGLFLNSLPLRLRVDGLRWRELVCRVEETGAAAQPFRHYPLAQIQSDSRIDLSGSLFNFTSFHVYENMVAPLDASVQNSFEANNYHFASEFAKAVGGATLFTLSVKADAALFPPAALDRIGGYYRNILAALANDAGGMVDRAALLGEQELAQVAALAMPAPRTAPDVLSMFEAQARRNPGRVALVSGRQELGYGELDALAERLADRIAACGVQPGAVVAVCMERTPAMVAALLAVFKVGAAYLPLDPAHPQARREFMLADSGAALVLCDAATAAGQGAVRVLEVDMDAAEQAPARRRAAPDGTGLAYLIYTSGSTGTPKGVMVSRAALANFIDGASGRAGIDADARWLAITTISFDIAGFELFGPLTRGARVCLAGPDAARDAAWLSATIEGQGISVLQATPSSWAMMLAAGWDGAPGLLGLVGGEAFPADLARALVQRCGRGVLNCYGPTEATIWSHIAPVVGDGAPVAVAGLLPGYGHCVVDAGLVPVGAGVAGELVLTGPSLADGYRGRPELSAEKFTRAGAGALAGLRLYRTGDLVRRLDGDRLEFLGRMDDQVKIRGYRIELGEIESRLRASTLVGEAAVIAADAEGTRRLVACVVPAPGGHGADTVERLRRELAAVLPDYMVPSAFVLLERMPHTPNGKLDRKALSLAAAGDAGEFAAPAGEMEARMCALWAHLLKRERIGATADFFDAGGDSLLATRLLAQVNQEFGCGLAIKDVFNLRTVRALALHVELLVARAAAASASQCESHEKEEIEW